MEGRDTLKILATIEAVINGVIPTDKKLTNEEKLDVIYGGRDEKINEAIRQIDEMLEAISERKEIWIKDHADSAVLGKQVNLFLDALITDLGNMKKTLE